MYLHWALPHRRPKGETWQSSSGVEVYAEHGFGLPYLRARAILVFIATRMIEANSRMIMGSLDEINERFGTRWPISNLKDHFLRVVHSEYSCPAYDCVCPKNACVGRHPLAAQVNFNFQNNTFMFEASDNFHYSVFAGLTGSREQVMQLLQLDQLAAVYIRINLCRGNLRMAQH